MWRKLLAAIIISAQIVTLGWWGFSELEASDTTKIAQDTFTLINQERARLHLPELTWDTDLAEMAVEYSKYMQENNDFNHSKLGYAENIAFFPGAITSGEELFNLWGHSRDHYQIMIDPYLRYGAVGVTYKFFGSNYATFLAH